jgi:hypothetical protein
MAVFPRRTLSTWIVQKKKWQPLKLGWIDGGLLAELLHDAPDYCDGFLFSPDFSATSWRWV